MKRQVDKLAKWCYQGVWGFITRGFRVPEDAPTLPQAAAEPIRAFKPSENFLAYLKFYFWFGLVLIDGALTVLWIMIAIASPWIGLAITPVALAVIVLPDIVAYIAIHLRYDTTWYVLSDRSLRIRRGIWVIHETTLTFENIQNVNVNQGPIQRWFDVANIVVSTAGGGGSPGGDQHGHATALGAHVGLIEGIANAGEIRELIMGKLRRSRNAGLGDEVHAQADLQNSSTSKLTSFSEEHLKVLREIASLSHQLAKAKSA
jgi:membrane protein YdbS with pleckstrin-like domain